MQFCGRLLILMSLVLPLLVTAKPDPHLTFHPDKLLQKFETIYRASSQKTNSAGQLKQTIHTLTVLNQRVKACAKQAKTKVKNLKNLLQDPKIEKNISQQKEYFNQLRQSHKKYQQQFADCKVLHFRISQTLVLKKHQLDDITAHKLFERGEPVWEKEELDKSQLGLIAGAIGFAIITLLVLRYGNITSVPRRRCALTLVPWLVAMIIGASLLGYHVLAMYLLVATIATIMLSIIFYLCYKVIVIAEVNLTTSEQTTIRKFRYYLGVRSDKDISELGLLKYALLLCLFIVLGFSLLKVWHFPTNTYDLLWEWFFSGFKLNAVEFVPIKAIWALVTFSILLLFVRIVSSYTERKHQDTDEVQVAFASIIFYVGFALSLLMALLIAGVNFTGLAVIAGALSVGVGMGLKDVVNNFVCGLILLLEKPIKPGDRIIVGGTEGFVKKVRIRSTQITTLANDDLIVPNTELVTREVTNYMYRNLNWALTCRVGVAIGSDINLVRACLLKVAEEHPEVLHSERKEPKVFLAQFREESLIFRLRVMIRNVNLKYQVKSDLNQAIINQLRAHNIVVRFPQGDGAR